MTLIRKVVDLACVRNALYQADKQFIEGIAGRIADEEPVTGRQALHVDRLHKRYAVWLRDASRTSTAA